MNLHFELNLAQAYKWSGNIEKCNETLTLRDYSELGDKYVLGHAILLDKFQNAADIMKKIGKNGEIGEIEYGNWPIFREFRKTKIFQDTFREIFGTDITIQTDGTDVELRNKKNM